MVFSFLSVLLFSSALFAQDTKFYIGGDAVIGSGFIDESISLAYLDDTYPSLNHDLDGYSHNGYNIKIGLEKEGRLNRIRYELVYNRLFLNGSETDKSQGLDLYYIFLDKDDGTTNFYFGAGFGYQVMKIDDKYTHGPSLGMKLGFLIPLNNNNLEIDLGLEGSYIVLDRYTYNDIYGTQYNVEVDTYRVNFHAGLNLKF